MCHSIFIVVVVTVLVISECPREISCSNGAANVFVLALDETLRENAVGDTVTQERSCRHSRRMRFPLD